MYLSPSWCILCKRAIDNVDHILLHCNFVNDVWVRIFEMFGVVGAFPKSWAEFIIIKWTFKHNSKKLKLIWRFAVLALAWSVWMDEIKGRLRTKATALMKSGSIHSF